MPKLEAGLNGKETWALTSNDLENPVGLTVTARDAPLTTKAEVHAFALEIDRLAGIEAEHLPLIPFGAEADRTLAALSPEAADRLAAFVSPRDATRPQAPPTAAWSLDIVGATRRGLARSPVAGAYRSGGLKSAWPCLAIRSTEVFPLSCDLSRFL